MEKLTPNQIADIRRQIKKAHPTEREPLRRKLRENSRLRLKEAVDTGDPEKILKFIDTRTANTLIKNGVAVSEALSMSDYKLLRLPGIGRRSIANIRRVAVTLGVEYPVEPAWSPKPLL